MHNATRDLELSGIAERVLKRGDQLPRFKLSDQDGALNESDELLA
ncbi:MAG: hypothetical protein ACE361_25930 [Aureliella sp.]